MKWKLGDDYYFLNGIVDNKCICFKFKIIWLYLYEEVLKWNKKNNNLIWYNSVVYFIWCYLEIFIEKNDFYVNV